MKLTRAGRAKAKAQKRADMEEGLRIAVNKWNKMTPAQKKANAKWKPQGGK